MSFNSDHPRDKSGKFISKASVQNYEKLQNKNIEHFDKWGSTNDDKYKGLNKEQKDIVDSFGSFDSNRSINEISALDNNGVDFKTITEKYGKERVDQYIHVTNYMQSLPAHKGEITRLIRDDSGVFNKFNVGDEMNFDRLTSFGEKGNEFKINGGNTRIHIKENTRGKNVKNLMRAKEEREVIINVGKYKVIEKIAADYADYNLNHIYLEEI